MNSITISGSNVLGALVGIVFIVSIVVFVLKYHLSKQSQSNSKNSLHDFFSARNKYPSVDVFKWRTTFLNASLMLSVCIVLLAFNWTQYDAVVDIPDMEDLFLEELMQEPPRTTTPPPPLPPPPPPVIEEVPEDEITEEEEVEFVDQLIEPDDIVKYEPVAAPIETKPPLPPPPPVQEDAPPLDFMIIEDKPLFQKCKGIARADQAECFTTQLQQRIYSEIRYPPIARENGIEGNVIVSFLISKEGKMEDIQILRSPKGGLDSETLRVMQVIQGEETFIPGKQRGKPVPVRFTLPVFFKLQD